MPWMRSPLRSRKPRLQHAAQRGVQVAVVQQVVGDLLEDAIGVEVEPDLRAVPAGVGEPGRHAGTLSGAAPPSGAAIAGAVPPDSARAHCRAAVHELPTGGGGRRTAYPTSAPRPSRTLVPMRVPRTFVFADLSGFTNYTAANGDDAAAFLLSAFRSVAREVASDRGVRIAKWLGDGCMIVAVDHADGVAAALDLDERARKVCAPLALRVGRRQRLLAALRGRRLHRPRPSTWPPGCATPPAPTRC